MFSFLIAHIAVLEKKNDIVRKIVAGSVFIFVMSISPIGIKNSTKVKMGAIQISSAIFLLFNLFSFIT